MSMDILRAELERLFELDELLSLSRDLLGFDPEHVGGAAAKGSFAKALAHHCLQEDAVEALCDVLFSIHTDVDPRLEQLRTDGPVADEELKPGDTFAGHTIVRKLGDGRLAISYVGRRDGKEVRLKVLRREATRDRRGLQRFLTVSRLVGGIDHPSLPRELFAGLLGGRFVVTHAHVDGQPLSARIARTGPMHLNEARPVLKAVLEALQQVHGRRLAHGAVRLDNVLLQRVADGSQHVVLLDAGMDRLRARPRVINGAMELFSTVGSPRAVAPEQIKGLPATPRSDLYSFGALLYELLTGKPLFFDATVAQDIAAAHLGRVPPAPSTVAPRGWVTKELDDFVLSLLAKSPEERPAGAGVVLEGLDRLGRASAATSSAKISEEQLNELIDALVAEPESDDAAIALEAALEDGADPARVAEAFTVAAESVEAGDEASRRAVRKSLWFRAARCWELGAKNLEGAEQVYALILEQDPNDDIALTAMEDVRRRQGKHEELIEMLLARGESASSAAERARAFAEIGKLYATELDDKEQALVAYGQAYAEDPGNASYAEEVEKLAGTDQSAWGDVLTACNDAIAGESLEADLKNLLLVRVGRWYAEKLTRPDLGLPCFQQVLVSEPSSEAALEGMTQIYRKAQQWVELGMVLTRRADAAAPAQARDLRAEAAEILEIQLNDVGRARDLYEQILAEDPGHAKASEALARIYERTEDWSSYSKLLQRRADALRGEEQLAVLCRIAELTEDHLHDDAEAARRYEAVLALDPAHLDALRGLDRLYSKAGRFGELLDNLRQQVKVAATPRQKITLWERIAGIYDEEYLDHEKAADAWEQILGIDGAHEGALTALVRHYRALDRWEQVAALYERHLKLVTESTQRVQLGLALGRVLAEQIGSPERATTAYERVLEAEPTHAGALEALARLRESVGDADAALTAIEALAEKAEGAQARAEQWVRAARLLEGRGDRDGAIERYKRALDANPADTGAALALRTAYVARGDVNAAIQLLEREAEKAEGERQRAKLNAEIAVLSREKLKDDKRAEEAAKRAIGFDPTNLQALGVLGDIAFENKRFIEATRYYEQLADNAGSLEKSHASRLLVRYVDALAQTGSTEKALAAMDTLLRVAPDDVEALLRVAQVTFEAGSAKRAVDLYDDIFKRFGETLKGAERALTCYRFGEARRRAGELEAARPLLEEAMDLDPSATEPLIALAALHLAAEQWEAALKIKARLLDLVSGDERIQLLLEMGDLAASKLSDRTRAAKSYVAALDERPDDRRLLTKLMQLYSEEKDWTKLIEVVVRLADFVEDDKQKAKYLQTAAGIAARQMSDVDKAMQFYEQVRKLDPSNFKALDEQIELARDQHRHEEFERLLKRRIELASQREEERPRLLECLTLLAELYEHQLGEVEKAIDAYEAAQNLEPDDRVRNERLAELYASDPAKYLDKAVSAQALILRQNPHRAEAYKLLRRLYTETKHADAAWCMCQALYVLNLAEPDEERFYKRMRSETAAPATAALEASHWTSALTHSDADPLLTSLFALIEPAVIATRSEPAEASGYDPAFIVDLERHPYTMSQTLYYAAGVLGLSPPVTYENRNDPGGLSFLHAQPPAIVLGMAALDAEVPPQAAGFIAARHLTYFQPGFYLRQLVPTATGLKSWLFAAIKLIVTQFPVAADLEGPVTEAQRALEKHLSANAKDELTRLVGKLLQSGASLDLKRWIAAVDLTADRAGFFIAHDLETAVEIVRASDEGSSAVAAPERLKELVLFAVSKHYFALRAHSGITIDT